MGEIVGESPRPWTIVIGTPNTESGKALVDSLPGTVERRDGSIQIHSVRQANFDAAIIFGPSPHLDEHLMVMQIGGRGVHDEIEQESLVTRNMGHSSLLSIESGNIPEGVSMAEVRALAENIRKKQPHDLIHRFTGETITSTGITPIIREKDGDACAGWWRRGKKGGPEWWWLPADTPSLASWRTALYSRWNAISPRAFPENAEDWTKSPTWMTPHETSATRALEEHKKETVRILSSRKVEAEELELEIQRIAASVGAASRLLLTAQSKPLVSAVATFLERIGFTVVDSDEQKEEGSYLLEDLKVSYEGWVCLAEVRGYAKGAKTSDFQRIERAVRHYEREHHSLPNARWYVVNHNLKTNPSLRPAVLAGADDDIEVFAEENGLVIDTRELFQMAKRIEEGRLTPDRARELLMTCTGVLSAPPEQGGAREVLGGQPGDQTRQPAEDTPDGSR